MFPVPSLSPRLPRPHAPVVGLPSTPSPGCRTPSSPSPRHPQLADPSPHPSLLFSAQSPGRVMVPTPLTVPPLSPSSTCPPPPPRRCRGHRGEGMRVELTLTAATPLLLKTHSSVVLLEMPLAKGSCPLQGNTPSPEAA